MGQANHYEGIRQTDETDAETIARVTAGSTLIKNDIFVIKTLIVDERYSYTAYVYDGSNWCAMDGNYSIDNIYFTQDLTTTANIGTIEIEDSGTATIAAAGKNLKEVLNTILIKEKNPIIVEPTVTTDFNIGVKYEVGTKIIPSLTYDFSAGSYEFGPTPTGVVATKIAATDSLNNSVTSNTSVITLPELSIAEDTEYTANIIVTYSAGSIPVTNLGKTYSAGQIKSGEASAMSQSKIVGYRAFFYGAVDWNSDTPTSDQIRELTNGGEYISNKSINIKGDSAAKAFIVALPNEENYGLSSVSLTTTMNLDILSEYELLAATCEVKGANGYAATTYKIYRYMPAMIDSNENHVITLA